VQGNCLFNALSDQLYGNQDMHEVLRAHTIEHMKGNADFYRQYMAVNSVRRNPKRRTAAAASKRIDTTYYTEEQLQQQFEEHVEKMGQPGEWADNMEVSAFASALNVHVRLWQADYTYLFSPRTYYTSEDGVGAEDSRQTLHIAYHVSHTPHPTSPPSRVLTQHRPGSTTHLSAT
jgi:OTU domain-containing protein 3